jgi:hypothetical protein
VKEKEAMPILESLGWKAGRDEVGDIHMVAGNDLATEAASLKAVG